MYYSLNIHNAQEPALPVPDEIKEAVVAQLRAASADAANYLEEDGIGQSAGNWGIWTDVGADVAAVSKQHPGLHFTVLAESRYGFDDEFALFALNGETFEDYPYVAYPNSPFIPRINSSTGYEHD